MKPIILEPQTGLPKGVYLEWGLLDGWSTIFDQLNPPLQAVIESLAIPAETTGRFFPLFIKSNWGYYSPELLD